MKHDTRPTTPPSRGLSSRSSSRHSLTLDLSNLPPLSPPIPPSNTLLFTNLQSPDTFRPDNLQSIRELVEQIAPIHAWAPLKSFRRIVVSFFDEEAALRVRQVWDGEAVLGSQCRVYFGSPTPTDDAAAARDRLLALPDAGKLFFISPPPSPPHGWEMRREEAPNKMVHADDLAEALARLRHHHGAGTGDEGEENHYPVSPVESATAGPAGTRRSRSSTIVFQPQVHGGSPDLPSVTVDDMTDEPETMVMAMSPSGESRPIMAHTARPPVELMHDA